MSFVRLNVFLFCFLCIYFSGRLMEFISANVILRFSSRRPELKHHRLESLKSRIRNFVYMRFIAQVSLLHNGSKLFY